MTRFNPLLLGLLVALSLLLIGCPTGTGNLDDDDDATDDDDVTPPDDDDDDTADDDDATDPPPEVAEVLAVHPLDGAEDHFVHEDLWVDFDIEAPDAEVTLADAEGNDIPGEGLWVATTRLAFNPTDALGFVTPYTATVAWGPKDDPRTQSWGFTTSDVGDGVTEADLVGSTFAYDLGGGTVVAPAGGEAILDQFNATFLQGVDSQTETEISFIGALAAADTDPPEQDLCSASVDLNEKQPAVWLDPFFSAGPADIPQTLEIPSFGVVDVTFRDVEVSGVFASTVVDGPVDVILEGTFSATVDVRDAGFGDVCDQLGLLVPGLTCVTCPHDPSSNQCIIFDLIDLQADLVDALVLIEWTDEDVAANPACP